MFERTALPAGPRVISARLPAARSVSIAAYVLAGSRLETAGEIGVAHFMEHITFKGTAAYPTTRAISEAIEGVGGSFNAATDRESTVYWVRVPRREADRGDGRPRRADRPADARRRRDRERADGHHRGDPLLPRRPVRVLPDPVPDGDVRRRAAGSRDLRRRGRIRALPEAAIREFWRTAYRPANTVVAVVGDLAHDEAVEPGRDGLRDRQRRGPGLRAGPGAAGRRAGA